MSLVGQGLFQRKSANFGLGKVAELEAQENAQADALESAKQAGQGQMLSTGAGIGASYGVQNALAQNAAFTPAPVVDGIATHAAGSQAVLAGEAVVGDVVASSVNAAAVEGATTVVAETALAETGAVVAGEVVSTAAPVVAEAAAGTAAAGTGGALGTLGAIAAPVAIGLGVAFLLNKLFD